MDRPVDMHFHRTIERRSLTRVAYFDPDLPGDLVELLWSRPQALVADADSLQATSERATVRVQWSSGDYVLKHYKPTWWHAAKQLVLPSRAWQTWTATHRFVDEGIPTPRPVACIENRWGPLRRHSYLMYPYVPGRTLRSYLAAEAKHSPLIAETLWLQLGDLWQRLAKLQASLADANALNFIISPDLRLWVIDLDRTRFHRDPAAAARHQQLGWKKLLRSAAKSV